jgi:hypothetical protein
MKAAYAAVRFLPIGFGTFNKVLVSLRSFIGFCFSVLFIIGILYPSYS